MPTCCGWPSHPRPPSASSPPRVVFFVGARGLTPCQGGAVEPLVSALGAFIGHHELTQMSAHHELTRMSAVGKRMPELLAPAVGAFVAKRGLFCRERGVEPTASAGVAFVVVAGGPAPMSALGWRVVELL